MKIQVNGYTYETGKHRVKLGDVVILPTAEWLIDVQGPTWEGKVSSLDSDYDGPCKTILGVAKSKKKS